jgi:signal transduction histidine kinase
MLPKLHQYCVYCRHASVCIAWIFVICFTFAANHSAFAQSTQTPVVFDLSSGNDHQELHAGVQFYEDADKNLRLSDVSAPNFEGEWKTFQRNSSLSFGFTRAAYWLRFAVRNTTLPNYNNWLFEIAFPPLDSLDIFVPQADGTMRLFRTGDHVPFHKREIRFRTFVVPLALPDSVPKTVYVRVRTTSSMNLPMAIYQREAFIETGIASLLMFGIFIGVVIVLALYNLMPYFISREQIYLRYLVYMLGAVMFILTYNGIMAEYIFPQSGFLLQYATLFSVGVVFLGLILLLQEFLQTRILAPRLHQVLQYMLLYWIANILAGLFFDYLTVNVAQALSVLPCTALFVFISFRVQRVQKRKDEYFLFVNLAFYGALTSGIMTMMANLGVISNSILTRSSTQISILFDGIMFSLALTQRFQTLRQEKVQAQEETLLLQQNQNIMLQRAVDERTAELQERNTELAALNDEKTELMGIVAHDLKNPIGAMRSLADLVQSGYVELEQAPEITGKIVNTADRMLDLVTNLLDLNRLEEGKMVFTAVTFDITPLASAIVEQYRAPAEAKRITLRYSSEAASSIISADEQATVQVLDNIISNAVKYSPHGKNVFVRLKSSTEAVRVEVQDEGEGISPDDMKKLFGKFARLSARPTGGEHSTGLGLSIVKKMVEAMNGRVWCESELGKGATFIVELPRDSVE